MSAMEIMLKSMGINTDEIKQALAQYGQLVVDLHERQVRADEKLTQILRILEVIQNDRQAGSTADDGTSIAHAENLVDGIS